MAHLSSSAAIFSPSVARIAASNAKDWKLVDDWLASKFQGRNPPAFERNAETLQALLTLASLNETADEERQLVAQAEASALRELQDFEHASPPSDSSAASTASIREDLLDALRDSLSRDAQGSLDAMAALAVELDALDPTPELLGRKIVELQAQTTDLEDSRARLRLLHAHVQNDMRQTDELITALQGWKYTHAPDLARQNLDMQRRLKTLSAKLPDLEERLASAGDTTSMDHPTVDDIARMEADHLALLSRKAELDAQVAQFAGLPDDPDAARGLLDQFRGRLRSQTLQRDSMFEGLVERESPRKKS